MFDIISCFYSGALESPRRASILIGLLWCVALLSVVVIGVLHTSRIDLMVTKNYGDRIQAHYLALAGIEKAKALLYQNAHDRSRTRRNHTGELYNDDADFRDVALGRGEFRVIRRGRQDEGGGIIYGVGDEEGRLNVNTADSNQLTHVSGIGSDIVAAIMDWRSGGNNVTPGGAKNPYYLSLRPPYRARNGPLLTVRELLMVRGISADLLSGEDTHENEFLETAPDDADAPRADNRASDVDAGWAGIMTVDSGINNVNAAGEDRVNIQNADQSTLGSVSGITPAIANAIVSYRGQNQFPSIADLLDVTAGQPGGFGGGVQGRGGRSGQNPGSGGGPHVIDENLLMEIADDITVAPAGDLQGTININTAGIDVLASLPGVDRELAQAIISYRQSSGYFQNVAYLLQVPGMTHEIFQQVAPLVSARSETYRIISEGRVKSTGVRQRIQMIVRVNLNTVGTLSYREDDL